MTRKKRKRKRRSQASKALQYELFGLLFIFLSIFGSGASLISEGFIPTGLENAFRFFLGIWYFVASIILFIIGIYFVLRSEEHTSELQSRFDLLCRLLL